MCDVLGGSCDCGSHMSLGWPLCALGVGGGGACVWEVIVEVWPPGCYVDVVDSCVDCVNAYVRQYTDRNKVLHQYMYVVMVMV